jgi:flagellar protein FlbD
MIKVTRLNHTALILNSDLIEHIEITPDTVITLTSGQKLMVLESAEEIVERVVVFRKSLFSKELFCPLAVPGNVQNLDRSCRTIGEESSCHGK